MRCNGADDWSFRFVKNGSISGFPSADTEHILEARPVEMSFKRSTKKYDYCRVKFSSEVGRILKQEVDPKDGMFSGKIPVQVKYKDEPIHTLLFRPDWARFGYDFVTVQLKDLHKSLSSGNINIQKSAHSIRAIYEEVLSSSPQNVISGIDFSNIPESKERDTFAETTLPFLDNNPIEGSAINPLESNIGGDTYFYNGQRVYENMFSIDIDDLSPEKAIQKLNRQFGLQTWIDSEAALVVGLPEAGKDSIQHIAAPDDSRVWRYKNPKISYDRNPVEAVLAFGAWEDAAGLENPLDWFDEGGFADARVVGTAKRTDVSGGELVKIDVEGAKKGSIESAARLALIQETKDQNSGRIEIDPQISGTQVSHPIDIQPGDLIRLAPSDEYFENPGRGSGRLGDPVDYPDKVCGGTVKNEAYFIRGVEHEIDNNGAWEVSLELALYPRLGDENIETSIQYFDPNEEEYYTEAEMNTTFDWDGTVDNVLFEQI